MTSPRPHLNRAAGRLSISASAAPRPLTGSSIGADRRVKDSWRVKVLTLFPEMFPGPLGQSLLGKALDQGLLTLETLDIRRFALDKHRTVDDTPAGGGPGMVMRPDVIAAAIDAAQADARSDRGRWPVIYLSPRGAPFTQAMAQSLAAGEGATLLCGRYEGVDQRVLEARGVVEVSMGDFIMTGGEIPAMALIDAVARLRPGVLGKIESTVEESFSAGLLEHPQYTRPQVWEGREIPEVLLSGHHAKIAWWRTAQAEKATKERRPDLWRAYADPDGEAEQSDGKTAAHGNPRRGHKTEQP